MLISQYKYENFHIEKLRNLIYKKLDYSLYCQLVLSENLTSFMVSE